MSCIDLRDKIEQVLKPLVEAEGFALADLHWRSESCGWVLRLILNHESRPITLSDCEKISRLVGKPLDSSDLIRHGYCLEVSSPGIKL
ncbi:MAG: hypothetical protein HY747_02795 [Elusimicrobia bacterium]|nr:hypothetical protein [Elusimicrobiota bacterium]